MHPPLLKTGSTHRPFPNGHTQDLLYLVHRVPYPPDKGDRIRAFHLLRFLAQRANVHLACLADEPVGPETKTALKELCTRVAIIPVGRWSRWLRAFASLAKGRTVTEGAFASSALRTLLRQWTSATRFHGILASASSMVPYLQMPELRKSPAVVDLVDVDSQKWLDYAQASRGPKRWLYQIEGRRLRQLETELPTWTHAVTLVSEAETALYQKFSKPGNILPIPNGVDLQYFSPPFEGGAGGVRCVFVGALDYRPNVDGACWFAREVWPTIHRQYPQAKLLLVGRRPTPAVTQLAEIPGVEVVGQVPDVRPYVADATVVVVPLHIARGLQNKVLEALAMAKPVVASPQALAGVRAEPGVHLLSASTVGEWHDAVIGLLEDEPLRTRLGQAGRRFVEEHHCWESCLEPMAELLGLPLRVGPTLLSGPAHG